MSHLAPWTLVGPREGVCQQCAIDHPPELPHNCHSLYYKYHFYNEHGRWPTWRDAMAHCQQEIQDAWTQALAERGVGVDDE